MPDKTSRDRVAGFILAMLLIGLGITAALQMMSRRSGLSARTTPVTKWHSSARDGSDCMIHFLADTGETSRLGIRLEVDQEGVYEGRVTSGGISAAVGFLDLHVDCAGKTIVATIDQLEQHKRTVRLEPRTGPVRVLVGRYIGGEPFIQALEPGALLQ